MGNFKSNVFVILSIHKVVNDLDSFFGDTVK